MIFISRDSYLFKDVSAREASFLWVFSYLFISNSDLTLLYSKSIQTKLEPLFEIYEEYYTIFCLDPIFGPVFQIILQDGDTNSVYFLAIRNFYKDLSVFLEI